MGSYYEHQVDNDKCRSISSIQIKSNRTFTNIDHLCIRSISGMDALLPNTICILHQLIHRKTSSENDPLPVYLVDCRLPPKVGPLLAKYIIYHSLIRPATRKRSHSLHCHIVMKRLARFALVISIILGDGPCEIASYSFENTKRGVSNCFLAFT